MARKSAQVEKKEAITFTVEEKSTLITEAFQRPQLPKKEEVKPKSNDLVCVALNRPYGIAFRMPDGRKVEFRGNGESLIGREKGVLPVGAYGLTMVDREDFEWIYKNFKSMPVFKNGLCFATKRKADATEEAESRDDLRNGLEPVDISRTSTKEAQGE